MKTFILLAGVLLIISCGDSMHVTGNPDSRAATSGTLGGAKAENQIPRETRDTASRRDTTSNPHDQ